MTGAGRNRYCARSEGSTPSIRWRSNDVAGRLGGKVALITGAASGIGAASARLFAAEGARLMLVDVNCRALTPLVEDLERSGAQVISSQADVAKPTEVAAAIDATIAKFGHLHVLFANAGISGRGLAPEMPIEEFDRIMEVNVRGAFLCARYAIPHIARAGGGSIIFTASELALVGSPGGAAYCASKAALLGMARALALDHGKQGIRVNCLCPGAVDTPLLWSSAERLGISVDEYRAEIISRMPLGRIGQPEEIARAALFLASDDSSFMTGTALVVDGGWTAR
uniref:SDR family oxidoreductase n=1 Tax=Thermorudis sp. TaxID=1969470 RepID=A0A7C3A9F0_9BACT